jgi:diadenosine tetraphosphate (Ap4A) HIT family hydrolase
MVDLCRADAYPARIAKLASGWAVLGDRQAFEGQCLLLPDPVVNHLNVLGESGRTRFLADMARVGDAVLRATDAVRINYAMFGNEERALHAHVIPRQAHESPELLTKHPWVLDWRTAPEFSEALHGEVKKRIAAYLAAG